MAFPTTSWYVNSVAYAAVTAWSAGASVSAGALRRQSATPTVGNERVFVVIVGGAAGGTEPTWVVTRGAKTTDNTATLQECTGQAGVNGDITNTPAWLAVKNTAVSLGVVIKDGAGTHLFIASTAGNAGTGSEPTWNTSAVGNTTTDNTTVWTYIGLASSFGGAAAPHARIPNALALTWSQAGESLYVGDNHAETSAANTTIAGQTSALSAPNYVLCHGHTGNYPPQSGDLLTSGPTITQSGGTTFQINAANLYMRGVAVVISANSIAVTLGNFGSALQRFDSCPITFSGTAGSSNSLSIGTSGALRGSKVIQDNCTLTFNNASQNIQANCAQWEWRNSAFAGTAPTTLLNAGAGIDAWIHGVDLSLIGTTKKLVSMPSSTSGGIVVFDRCKIDNAVTVATVTSMTSSVILSKCDAGGVNYRDELYGAQGTLITEATIIRTGGQSDGTTPISRKAVTGPGSLWMFPFECQPIAIWNETAGSAITVTLYGIWGGGAVPNNDDFWIDVEYLGSSGSPISSRASSSKSSILASNAALSTDASTWGGSTTPFKTSVTITPQMKGYIYVVPKAAKPSSTFYYDEKLNVA